MTDDPTAEAGTAAATAGATAGASNGATISTEAPQAEPNTGGTQQPSTGDGNGASADMLTPDAPPPTQAIAEPLAPAAALPLLTDEQLAQVIYAMVRVNADLRGDSSYPIWGQVPLDKQIGLIADVNTVRAGGEAVTAHRLIAAVVSAFDAETSADEEF